MIKKICFLVGYYPINRGGAEYQSFLLSRELKKYYDIFYISIGQKTEVEKVIEGTKVYSLKTPRRRAYFLLKPKIHKIFQYEKPDFIYQRVAYSVTGIAARYCKGNKCKLLWHIANKPDVEKHKIKFNKNIFINYIETKYLEFGIKHADYIIGQAKYQDNLLNKNFDRKCDLIVKNFHPLPTESINKSGKIKVVWIANFKSAKQPKIFVELARRFEPYSRACFIMVGRNPEYLGNYKITDNVKIVGSMEIDDVNELLTKSHIFVNTSLYEGFPNTFIQAWMRKVPVVSLNVDPDDVLKEKKIGFHSKNFNQMIKDISKLIDNKQFRLEMGERAQQYAFENHSLKNIEKIVELLENSDGK